MNPRSSLRMLVLVAACLTLGGCSLFLVDGPPSAHASMRQFACDESNVWPAVDAGVTALGLVGIVFAEESVDTTFYPFGGYNTNTVSRTEYVVANAVTAGLFGVSAFVGKRRVGRCRSAYEQLRARLSDQRLDRPGS